jgi:hypothetical protein
MVIELTCWAGSAEAAGGVPSAVDGPQRAQGGPGRHSLGSPLGRCLHRRLSQSRRCQRRRRQQRNRHAGSPRSGGGGQARVPFNHHQAPSRLNSHHFTAAKVTGSEVRPKLPQYGDRSPDAVQPIKQAWCPAALPPHPVENAKGHPAPAYPGPSCSPHPGGHPFGFPINRQISSRQTRPCPIRTVRAKRHH